MNPVLRGILAVIAGFVVACAIMIVVESINGHVLYPDLAKQAQGVTSREEMKRIFAVAPVGSLLVVLFGWSLGSFTGGLIAKWIGKRPDARHAIIVGALIVLCAIANNLMLPPPAWFWALGVLLPIPIAMIGARLTPQQA